MLANLDKAKPELEARPRPAIGTEYYARDTREAYDEDPARARANAIAAFDRAAARDGLVFGVITTKISERFVTWSARAIAYPKGA